MERGTSNGSSCARENSSSSASVTPDAGREHNEGAAFAVGRGHADVENGRVAPDDALDVARIHDVPGRDERVGEPIDDPDESLVVDPRSVSGV